MLVFTFGNLQSDLQDLVQNRPSNEGEDEFCERRSRTSDEDDCSKKLLPMSGICDNERMAIRLRCCTPAACCVLLSDVVFRCVLVPVVIHRGSTVGS